MTIEAATQALLGLREMECSEPEWEMACLRLEETLHMSSAAEIKSALAADVQDRLPISIKSNMYERLLELGDRSPEVLRNYAWHLQLHGPDWDDKADALLAEADKSQG